MSSQLWWYVARAAGIVSWALGWVLTPRGEVGRS